VAATPATRAIRSLSSNSAVPANGPNAPTSPSRSSDPPKFGAHAAARFADRVDGLARDGILERRRSAQDRRNYALQLTDASHTALARLKGMGAEHEVDLCAALTDDERAELAQLMRRIADQRVLTPGVHPGFRRLGDQT
jgi:hypothetical protein